MFYVIGGKVKEVTVEKRTVTMEYLSATAKDGSFGNIAVLKEDLFKTEAGAEYKLYRMNKGTVKADGKKTQDV